MTKDDEKVKTSEIEAPSIIFYFHSLLLFMGRILNMILDLYNRIFDFSPRDRATIYNNISNHYLKRGAPEKALQYLREWTMQEPSNPEAFYRLAIALSDSGKGKHAINILDKTLKLKPDHRGAVMRKSTLQLKYKDYKGAVHTLEKAVKISPGKAKIHYLLGIAYEGLDELDKAVAAMEKATELDYNEIKYHQYLGFLNVRRDDHKTAAKSFTKVMELERQFDEE